LLLLEETPLLFMGDEYAASPPFLYFTEHTPELAALTATGREAAFGVFWAARAGEGLQTPDAQAESTFAASKLDWSEVTRPPHTSVNRLFRELLRLRREDVVFQNARLRSRAEVAGEAVLVVERGDALERRLIAVNFGDAVRLERVGTWQPVLSTAEERFAGQGIDLARLRLEAGKAVELPARSTTVWRAEAES
jgi:maltooligosyltrehalose trehalohydrolase